LAVPGYEVAVLTDGVIAACVAPYVGNEIIVAGTQNVGIVLPGLIGNLPGCGAAVYTFSPTGTSTTIGVEPPGASC
jgi:hypothetical protein